MKQIRLGIIGTGIAARKLHLPALQSLGNRFEITAVCNHTEAKAAEFSRRVGNVPYVLDYRELLRRDDVDAVDILLPIPLNYRVTRDALEAGKHVIVEKPIAASIAEARSMLDFPRRYRRVAMVAENCRYQAVFLKAGQLLKRGVIGRPYAAVWNIFQTVTMDNIYAHTRWRIQHRYPGGFLTDGGVHNAAVLRLLFGEVVSLSAHAASVNRAIGKQDTLSMLFVTSSGVRGVFNLFFSSAGHHERALHVFGKRGTLIVEDQTVRVERPGKPDLVWECRDDGGYVAEFLDFYSAIRRGTQVRSSFREGFGDLRVILSALESARRGGSRVEPRRIFE